MRWWPALLLLLPGLAWALAEEDNPGMLGGLDGRGVMQAVYERHQLFPYVYEELALVLVDRRGRRDSRQARRYTRVEPDGSVRFLLLFDAPVEVQGVGLLATRSADGSLSTALYLPALDGGLVTSDTGGVGGAFLGTDFSVQDIAGEALDDYRYVRRRNSVVGDLTFAVVDVLPRDPAAEQPLRRHFVRLDNLFITRTDHFDSLGRLARQQTSHDLAQVGGDMWRANMVHMDNIAREHRSLLKVQRRVFSRDYVPEAVFTAEWLRQNQPPLAERLAALAPELGAEVAP